MCGRFVSASPPDELANYFGADRDDAELEPSFNVAPTNEVYVVRARDEQRRLSALRWGLVPFWAKDLKIGSRMINARAETVAEKPAFRKAYERHRCLIPADGFFEWAKLPDQKNKQPYLIQRSDGEPVVFAGLWERWRPRLEDGKTIDDEAEPIETCTILTTTPNAEMSTIHDRMPVLLPPSVWDDWLSSETDLDYIGTLLRPAPDDLLTLVPISTMVNNVRNKGEELLTPLPPEAWPELPAPGSAGGDG
ncbi:MAG: SOS response-associated peptidase [Actinomycetota bacterium]